MIQSASNNSVQTTLGFEGLSRFSGPSPRYEARGDSKKSQEGVKEVGLTQEQQQQIQQLKQADRKVRAHEQAHLAVGADLVRGGPSFSYQTGPDNQRYAVAGEVSIDSSPGRTPQETIPKAQHVRATALAPADPSPQDHSVAAQASQMEASARVELSIRQREAASRDESAGARLYRGIEEGKPVASALGGRLDFYA